MAITYDSGVDTLYGDKLMLYISQVTDSVESLLPVAFGTSCNIDITADTLDSTNKMSGDWKEALVGQLGWSVGSESLLSTKEGHLSFKTLKEMFKARKPLIVVLGQSKTEAEGFAVDSEFVRGQAVITNLSMTAQSGQFCTCSIQLQGHGALDEGEATAE